MKNLETLPFGKRLGCIGYLLKHTFTVVGRERDLITPWIRTTIYGAVNSAVLVVGLGLAFQAAAGDGDHGGLAWLLLLLAFVLYIYQHFYNNYQEVAQSWLVYQAVTGEDRTYAEARGISRDLRSTVRKLALLDLVMTYVSSRRGGGKEGEASSGLVSVLLAAVVEIWDLLNHYLLPATTVDRLSIRDAIGNIRHLRERVPETLTGVFGIDFIGRIVGVIVAPVYLVLAVIAIGLGVAAADWLPALHFPVSPGQLPGFLVSDGTFAITIVPLLVLFYLGKLFSVALKRGITSIKVIYFTIFYLQITHPDWIADDLQDELVRYLKMEEPELETEPAGA
ncbi:MAG: hypothetical protein PVH31_03415 [Ectothiorhodospiraceae bacterium]|jgi:hypothetical protein